MNYFLWNLFGPSSWPLWLVLIAAVALLLQAHRLARLAVFASAALVVVMGVLPTGYWLMQRLEAEYARPDKIPANIAHIVVLAGAENLPASAASGALELNAHGERVSEAVALGERFPGARLWIVGGVSNGLPNRDVDWTADYWMRAGLNAARIGKIGGTVDTCGNAAGIARRLKGEPMLLVTSAFHMPRAMACMRAAGVAAIPYAVDRQTWRSSGIMGTFSPDILGNLARTGLALHEYVGLAYYRVTGRID